MLYQLGDFALFMVRVMVPVLILVGLFMPTGHEKNPLPMTQTLIIEGRL